MNIQVKLTNPTVSLLIGFSPLIIVTVLVFYHLVLKR